MTVIDHTRTVQRDPAAPDPSAADPSAPTISASNSTTSGIDYSSHPGGPGAKHRILTTANNLFYSEGIRAVGVDRLITESSVTKATFYKHFGAKETLVVSYIQKRHESVRAELTAATAESPTAVAAMQVIVDRIVKQARSQNFRGCAFINTATEFPDTHSAVREVVSAHRDWYTAFIADLFRQLGHPMPGDAADEFVLLRDGTMSGGYASDPIAATTALQRCVQRLLHEAESA